MDTFTKNVITTDFNDLSKFKLKRVLSDSSQRKLICVEGSFEDKEGASLLVLEKTAFNEDNVKLLCTEQSQLHKEFVNDIYGSYKLFPSRELNDIKATIIYPATDQHIQKYEKTQVYLIEETKIIHENITLPFILKQQLSLQWVYNILDHTTESDRIVFEDSDPVNGFILLPDLKWDGEQLETLYLLAICNNREIKSIRDLNQSHLKLLKNILESGSNAITKKYGIERSRLRIYFHYPPSFYHLHVHFTSIDFDAAGIYFERAHSLISVINNIELKSDYYSQSTLLFPVRHVDKLFELFKNAGWGKYEIYYTLSELICISILSLIFSDLISAEPDILEQKKRRC